MRRRRTPEQAQLEILEASAALLSEGGVAAVNVRAVAKRVGITDAGVHHHFGSREQLLSALLRHGGRKLRSSIESALTTWLGDASGLEALITELGRVYRDGFADLAISLYRAGWRDRGSGLLEPVVQALHARRQAPNADIVETRLAVAALHQALAMEPLFGAPFRRSAGITGRDAGRPDLTYQWWAEHLRRSLGLTETKRSAVKPS